MDTDNQPDFKKDGEQVKAILAEELGIEVADIEFDDSFAEDLHMTPTDLIDFIQRLASQGYDTTNLDLTEIQTLENLLEALGLDG